MNEEIQAVEIGLDGRAYIIGIPAQSEDEETGHNCDAMGCPSAAAHTLYVLPIDADHRAKEWADRLIQSFDGLAVNRSVLTRGVIAKWFDHMLRTS